MDDLREKVIKGIETCTMTTRANRCLKCPYAKEDRDTTKWCTQGLHRDILALLKAQEPKFVPDIAEAILGYRPQVKVGHCPSCGVLMTETDKFCRKCGQAVKWNE